ncbi:hypothetical protein BKA59DRAFT_406083 [Fusarium tricinctum]|uniref:YCII-related domain-containing protein n=1 Tax=Fusarium tricinctum TaxID=61284 RepID=A0A8K0RQQ8_9HYPO|nr:hypothetical protein BKA59DRAFT_406083 [Fusarium tricinctum]
MDTSMLRSFTRSTLRTYNLGLLSSNISRRTLVTGTEKKEFLCILPDKPNVLELRKSVKAGHYKGIQPLIASGKLPAGGNQQNTGAIFEKHPVDGEPALFRGSVVVYAAESEAEVCKIIENDIYATSGVWDLENTQIIPYVAAVREPLQK